MSMETDVNYLLLRQQMSLIRAQDTRSKEGRAAYEGLARGYSARIEAYREENYRMIVHAH